MRMFLNDPDGECTKNITKFLFFEWLGPHKFESVRITPWGAMDWHQYEATGTCALCGVSMYASALSEAALVRHYIPIEKLAECRRKDGPVSVSLGDK